MYRDSYTASQPLLIHKATEVIVKAVVKERGFDPLPAQYYEFFFSYCSKIWHTKQHNL